MLYYVSQTARKLAIVGKNNFDRNGSLPDLYKWIGSKLEFYFK